MSPKRLPKKISPELKEKLDEQDWPEIIKRLTYYAKRLLSGSVWDNEQDIWDFVSDAIEKVFNGQIKWDYNEYPNVYIILAGNVKSSIHHAFKRKKIQPYFISYYTDFDVTKINNIYYDVIKVDDNETAKRFYDFIYEYFKDDDKVLETLILIEEEKKRREIVKELNISSSDYDKILKKIKYASKKFNK